MTPAPERIAHRVLVLDDEPVIVELATEILRDVNVLPAGSIAEARRIVLRNPQLEVALVDKNLPDGSGLDFVRWLRQAAPDCEPIVITGYPSMDSAMEALSLGASDYLIKPLRDINELRVRVGHACARVDSRRTEKRLIAEIRASEERYRRLFEATADAVLVIDDETRAIVDVNAAAVALYGRPREQLVGMAASELRDPDVAPETRGGIVARRDRRADGTSIAVEVTTGALLAGRKLAIEMVRDVSERERAVAERGQLEARLAQAAKLEAVGRLAAGVAHDFNNVLTVVLGAQEFAESAIEAEDGAGALEELAQIREAVANGSALTRQLLVFSRPGHAKPQVIDLHARLETVVAMLERTLPANVRLALALAPVPTTVSVDPGQLDQIITNLVVNARDAMAARGGKITIETRGGVVAHGEPGVELVVGDDGPGIPADIVDRVFEPFFTTKGERGTGLGLANVADIVQRAGGTLKLASQVGAGTRFTIWLPVSEDAPQETRRLGAVRARGGEAVLVVEDDARVRENTQRMLESAGFRVHAVRDAETALAFVASGGAPRVVVADVELPGVSGIECVARLTEREPGLRVVFTSAVAADPRDGRGLPAGTRFLRKPYSSAELLGAVGRVLEGVKA